MSPKQFADFKHNFRKIVKAEQEINKKRLKQIQFLLLENHQLKKELEDARDLVQVIHRYPQTADKTHVSY